MTVATYTRPDYSTQTGTSYPGNIDAMAKVFERLAGAFAPHEQLTPDMTVRVDAGALWDGIDLIEVAAQSTGLIAAPVTNPRIDRIVVDRLTGVATVVTGTEALSPSVPAIAVGSFPVGQILLQPATTVITNSLITDERVSSSGDDSTADDLYLGQLYGAL